VQLFGNLKFDCNDVLWTLIGAVVFHIIWIFSPQKMKRQFLNNPSKMP
jgi:hypothetical protein